MNRKRMPEKPHVPMEKPAGAAGSGVLVSGEEGSTFVEVTVAIAILALVALVLWNGFSTANEGMKKGYELIRTTGSVLQVKRLLDAEIARVRIPFWEKVPEGFFSEPSELKIPFLDGERTSVLSLSLRDGFLVVGSQSDVKTVKAGADAALAFLPGKVAGFPLGIEYTSGGTELRIPFGSAGLRPIADGERK